MEDLLNKFLSLGTTDHNELVNQFCAVIPDASDDVARFFLEASNWSLQNSVSSYFDYAGSQGVVSQMQTLDQRPEMNFLCENSNLEVGTGQQFQFQFILHNPGQTRWPNRCRLIAYKGESFSAYPVNVPSLNPGESSQVNVHCQAPQQPGSYAGSYILCFDNGQYDMNFGEEMFIWVEVLDKDQSMGMLEQRFANSNMFGSSQGNPNNDMFNNWNNQNFSGYTQNDQNFSGYSQNNQGYNTYGQYENQNQDDSMNW
eukprot:TRINITY_DN7224_c0_g1_i1.p1 TRINITY_DN7224_c0_g1~~TRINITY_DN7224_c0_g1_i1.p1  ORF type:complete len:256 (-),score=35.26 TRINITY_DN7224_c0_g1_i1:29-796(-)